MKHQYITYTTGFLAKQKGVNLFLMERCEWAYSSEELLFKSHNRPVDLELRWSLQFLLDNWDVDFIILSCTQEVLTKWIREERGVHIMINRNGSGYFWEMMKADSGTNLGWSDHEGPNDGGVWDTYEGALENAMQIQLYTDLKKFGHWGNYAETAITKFKNRK